MDQELIPTDSLDPDLQAGALNLLQTCVGLCRGESLLIVGENHARAFFDQGVCAIVADVARRLGGRPTVIMAPETGGPEEFPESIARVMHDVDHTIFLSRLGDQVRFCPLPGNSTKTMCYIHDSDYLRDAFARIPYGVFAEVNELLLSKLASKRTCRISCPDGTDLEGAMLPIASGGPELTTDFSVKLFPVMITPPISASGLSGRMALNRWLMSTSTRAYDGSLLELHHPLVAEVRAGRFVGFDGDPDEVARVERHFERVAALVGGDAYAVNSWHAGSNPKTFFNGRAADNVEKWSDMVFGSPRYTHFHVCGDDPGDIAVSLIDATISFDGEVYWDAGRLAFLDEPEARQILQRYPEHQDAFEMRWDIGV